MATRDTETGVGPYGKPAAQTPPKSNGSNPTPSYKVVKAKLYPGQFQAEKDYQIKVWKMVGPETRKPDVIQRRNYKSKAAAEGRE
jgi:hypothetical protein